MIIDSMDMIYNIEDICTRLNSLARECGGEHLSPKEIEEDLLAISERLDDYAFQLVEAARVIQSITGMSNADYDTRQRINHTIWKEKEDDNEQTI